MGERHADLLPDTSMFLLVGCSLAVGCSLVVVCLQFGR